MTINNNARLFKSGNWNENNLNPLARNHWRASLVPAAAVIPAPIAYIKIVAVKKLVVGFLAGVIGPLRKECVPASSLAILGEGTYCLSFLFCSVLFLFCSVLFFSFSFVFFSFLYIY